MVGFTIVVYPDVCAKQGKDKTIVLLPVKIVFSSLMMIGRGLDIIELV
jgi:hypothetical protein